MADSKEPLQTADGGRPVSKKAKSRGVGANLPPTPDSPPSSLPKMSLNEEEKKWLKNEYWPTPKWFSHTAKEHKKRDYNTYLLFNLRTKYYDLEGDFRTAFGNFAPGLQTDFPVAHRIVEYLKIAREALESDHVNFFAVANLLDLVERYMIWLFPSYSAKERAISLGNRIQGTHPEYATLLFKSVAEAGNEDGDEKLLTLKAAYDEVVGEINKVKIDNQINSGLQIERLESMRIWGLGSLLVAIFVLPILANLMAFPLKDANANAAFSTMLGAITDLNPYWMGFSIIGVLAVMGALGGFVSGILQVRKTRVNLLEFKESVLKFQLKPLVGGLTAVLLAVLLSWQVLPGIKIESLGTFIMIAFLTGFSERYFLKLLQIDEEGNSTGANTPGSGGRPVVIKPGPPVGNPAPAPTPTPTPIPE